MQQAEQRVQQVPYDGPELLRGGALDQLVGVVVAAAAAGPGRDPAAGAAAAGGGSISGPLEVLSAMATRVKVFSPSEDQISKDQTLYASV